jgi:hypothetical protein
MFFAKIFTVGALALSVAAAPFAVKRDDSTSSVGTILKDLTSKLDPVILKISAYIFLDNAPVSELNELL